MLQLFTKVVRAHLTPEDPTTVQCALQGWGEDVPGLGKWLSGVSACYVFTVLACEALSLDLQEQTSGWGTGDKDSKMARLKQRP